MGGGVVVETPPARFGLWARAVLALLVWLAFVRVPEPAANADLDPSWRAVQAFILQGGLQCGVDTVFTFGPLGWFNHPTFVPELYGVHLVWEIVFKLVCACVCVAVLVRRTDGLDFCLAIVAILCSGSDPDGFALTVLFVNTVWIGMRSDRPLVISLISFAPSVALALVKFPYFLAFLLATAILAAHFSSTNVRRSILFTGGALTLFVTAWTISGQSAANLLAWIVGSAEIARGYGAALGVPTPGSQIVLLFLTLAAAAGAVAFAVCADSARGRILWVFLCASSAWLAFKIGFVRGQHKQLAAFDFVAVSLFALPLLGFAASRSARVLRRCACGAALAGHALVLGTGSAAPRALFEELVDRIGASVLYLTEPEATRLNLVGDLELKRADMHLPKVCARVGRDTIDVFGSAQSLVFANDLAYAPRPVFQSYAAYTPILQELNRRALSGERAPRWILFAHSALGGHFPPIEDAMALQELSQHYRLELEERGYLLLKRLGESERAPAVSTIIASGTAKLGETIDFAAVSGPEGLNARALVLRLDLRPSLLGTVSGALLKCPPLMLEIEDERGRVSEWSIAPGYVAGGFVVSPLLDTKERVRSWFHGEMDLRSRSARVSVKSADRWAFSDSFGFELRRSDEIAPPADPLYSARRLARVLRPPPIAIETSAGPEFVGLRESTEALVVGTPSDVRFDLEPGRYSLSAVCGLHARFVDPRAAGGAVFTVVATNALGIEREIERRALPAGANFGSTRIKTTIDSSERFEIHLRTARAAVQEVEAANAYWALVAIEREP